MKKDLSHLPHQKQRALERVRDILLDEFHKVVERKESPAKREGRVEKIILFGSYARGDYLDIAKSRSGYESDLDILVIVNDEAFAKNEYWHSAMEILDRPNGPVREMTTIIVHSLSDVNEQLSRGQYFFSDIKRDGIALYERSAKRPLADCKLMSPQTAYETAKEHWELWSKNTQPFLDDARANIAKGNLRKAAFDLHQAVEQLYDTVLLVRTNYRPQTHKIDFLRSFAEGHDARLIDAWPDRDRRPYKRWFDLLRRAYVEARYSKHYEVDVEGLEWLVARASRLQSLVKESCLAHLAALREKAGG